ncbi:MAG: hypothetical protein AB1644_04680 [Candidatus Zixiibacteriota bacterium]
MFDTLETPASTSFINFEAQQIITPNLSHGERLIWAGQPRQGFFLQAADIFMIPFSLAWGGFAIFWTLTAYFSGAPWFFVLWGTPFVAVGLWLMVGRFFTDSRSRAKTYYAVTDKRVLFVKAGKNQQTTSVDLKSVGDITFVQYGSGRGSILFGVSFPYPQAAKIYAASARQGKNIPMFNQVDRAKEVYDQIMRAKDSSKE